VPEGHAADSTEPLGVILVVDDDKSIRTILHEMLEAHGYRVLGAEDGPSAVRLARSESVDLAIVDLLMAPLDGVQTIEALREINPSFRVVVITGLTDDERLTQARALGIADFLYKPLDLRAVLASVRRLVQPRPPAAAGEAAG